MSVRLSVLGLSFGLSLISACGGSDLSEESQIQLLPVSAALESTGQLTLVARRIGDGRGEISAELATSDGTAKAGADFTIAGGAVSWADGDTADKTITISLVDDLTIEGDEQFTAALKNPLGAALMGEPITAGIRDDDRLGEHLILTNQERLVSIDGGTSTVLRHAATIMGLASGEKVVDIDYRPRDGKLYGLTSSARIVTIDPATGEASATFTLAADPSDASAPFAALDGASFGIDFNPVVDRLRVVSSTGQNLRINVDNGLTITDATIRGASTGFAATGYANNFAETCRTRLYGIDIATSKFLVQDPPNDGVTTALTNGLPFTAVSAGLDMVTSQTGVTTAFVAVTAAGAGGESSVHTFDLASGATSPVGTIKLATDERVRGMAVVPLKRSGPVTQVAGELYGVTDGNRFITFNRAAPAKPCTSTQITGLGVGDSIVGLDVRPSTGLVYILTNNAGTGATYVVNPTTAAATSRMPLSAALVGAEFGVDFNPTGPVALRVVSDAGQNLRVTDVTTGATVVDGSLNTTNGAASAGGAAYTNAAPGATATTLYTIDPAADRLRIQNPPNAGTQVDVGALGVDAAAIDGFDIDGRDSVAFVALALAGSSSTTFHTIDLTTGTVSASLGSLGTRLRGMARPTPTNPITAAAEALTILAASDVAE